MKSFIEELYYGNIDPQNSGFEDDEGVQRELRTISENEDYLADTLTEAGFVKGYLTSTDGFVRSLGEGTEDCTISLFRMGRDAAYAAASLSEGRLRSAVPLYAYPLSSGAPYDLYYEWKDGSVTSAYIDPADGRCRTAAPELLCFSRTKGCAETILAAAPFFVADSLDTDGLRGLGAEGIFSLWWEGDKAVISDPSAGEVKSSY